MCSRVYWWLGNWLNLIFTRTRFRISQSNHPLSQRFCHTHRRKHCGVAKWLRKERWPKCAVQAVRLPTQRANSQVLHVLRRLFILITEPRAWVFALKGFDMQAVCILNPEKYLYSKLCLVEKALLWQTISWPFCFLRRFTFQSKLETIFHSERCQAHIYLSFTKTILLRIHLNILFTVNGQACKDTSPTCGWIYCRFFKRQLFTLCPKTCGWCDELQQRK